MILDAPAGHVLKTPIDQLWGWFHTGASGPATMKLAGVPVDFVEVPRPDLPGDAKGFSIFADLSRLLDGGRPIPRSVTLELSVDGAIAASIEIVVEGVTQSDLKELAANRAAKRDFILRHARVELKQRPGCTALDALPSHWSISPALSDKKDAVSSHFYGQSINEFLTELPTDGFVLDAGAGLRKAPRRNVVAVEIYDYPSTDILAAGEHLPFEDNTFDAALSLAVLEHVRNPFVCARELVRVLKPGGKIMTIIPFLQAEHGYPSHYFNATRFGMQSLFSGCRMEKQYLEPSNHPVWTLNQIVGTYAHGLPPGTREKFLSLSVSDLIGLVRHGRPFPEWMGGEFIAGLDEEVAWQLAWGTTGIFVKPAA